MTPVKSPFKFLDPYEKSDITCFFGREKEVAALYDFVNKNRIVLLYGQSGTGKTSIIQCGLANEFDVTDWMPFIIRRCDNLNESFIKIINGELAKSVVADDMKNNMISPSEAKISSLVTLLFKEDKHEQKQDESETDDLIEKQSIARLVYGFQVLAERFLRPLYFIFDQFEELLILGSESEKSSFIRTLKILLGANTNIDCHIIIVMREEYFAWMDAFEKDIPGISDRRLRIEPMRSTTVKKVIFDSCEYFNITLAEPEKNTTQMIKALSKYGDVKLPYLQVYLDQLWRKDFERTYPDGYHKNEGFIPLTFTTEEIAEFGEIKDVMQRFLLEQKKNYQDKVKDIFPQASDNLFGGILDCFVNDHGSKMPNAYYIDNGFYRFKKKAPKLLTTVDKKILKFTLDFLQNSQILRNEGNAFELTHDILARLIDKQRDAKQQRLNGIRVMIGLYKKTNDPIPYDLVKSWERYIEQLNLKEDEKRYFDENKSSGEKAETKKILQQQVQNALLKREVEYKLESERKKSKRNKFLLAFFLILIFLLAFGYWHSLKVEDKYYAMDTISMLDSATNKMEALHLAKYAYGFVGDDSRKQKAIEDAMMKMAESPFFAKAYSTVTYKLSSASKRINGLDIDISGNGRFISVWNDSVQTQKQASVFLVFDINTNKIDTFYNVSYAYFLNHSDTLLLAFSDSASTFFNNYPENFMLYNCVNRWSRVIKLNNPGSSVNHLYNKEFLAKTTYSDRDSYKVRMMSSGKLLIPYFSLANTKIFDQKKKLRIFNLYTAKNSVVFDINSDYSISTSKNCDQVLYCYYKNDSVTKCEVFLDNGLKHNPFNNADYADFTENGSLVYIMGKKLTLCNNLGTVAKQIALTKTLRKVFTSNDANHILGLDNEGIMYMVDFADTARIVQLNDMLIGYAFRKERMVTLIKPNKNNDISNDTCNLILRDFKGKVLKKVTNMYGMETFSFNATTGNFLLKSMPLPKKENLQLLSLYDDTLGMRATFYLTPNDSYGFSENGQHLYFIRDKELMVFKDNNYLDISNFKALTKVLEIEKHKKGKEYQTYINTLQKNYHLRKFNAQRLGF